MLCTSEIDIIHIFRIFTYSSHECCLLNFIYGCDFGCRPKMRNENRKSHKMQRNDLVCLVPDTHLTLRNWIFCLCVYVCECGWKENLIGADHECRSSFSLLLMFMLTMQAYFKSKLRISKYIIRARYKFSKKLKMEKQTEHSRPKYMTRYLRMIPLDYAN